MSVFNRIPIASLAAGRPQRNPTIDHRTQPFLSTFGDAAEIGSDESYFQDIINYPWSGGEFDSLLIRLPLKMQDTVMMGSKDLHNIGAELQRVQASRKANMVTTMATDAELGYRHQTLQNFYTELRRRAKRGDSDVDEYFWPESDAASLAVNF